MAVQEKKNKNNLSLSLTCSLSSYMYVRWNLDIKKVGGWFSRVLRNPILSAPLEQVHTLSGSMLMWK